MINNLKEQDLVSNPPAIDPSAFCPLPLCPKGFTKALASRRPSVTKRYPLGLPSAFVQ
jgi:hypothetical protein